MIILLIKIFCIAWFITQYDPLQTAFDRLFNVLILSTNKQYIKTALDSIYIAFGCFKCMSFILTLLLTFNFYYAVILAMLAQIYTKLFISKKVI